MEGTVGHRVRNATQKELYAMEEAVRETIGLAVEYPWIEQGIPDTLLMLYNLILDTIIENNDCIKEFISLQEGILIEPKLKE